MEKFACVLACTGTCKWSYPNMFHYIVPYRYGLMSDILSLHRCKDRIRRFDTFPSGISTSLLYIYPASFQALGLGELTKKLFIKIDCIYCDVW